MQLNIERLCEEVPQSDALEMCLLEGLPPGVSGRNSLIMPTHACVCNSTENDRSLFLKYLLIIVKYMEDNPGN